MATALSDHLRIRSLSSTALQSSMNCSKFDDGSTMQVQCLWNRLSELESFLDVDAFWTSSASSSHWYVYVAFNLSALASILVSIDQLLNAKMRWRQLRTGAGSLESMIWCYRTRVGGFELTTSDANSRLPEVALRDALVAWRRDLVAGGDLQMSGLNRVYPPHVYKHHQFASPASTCAIGDDDHYSPVQPLKYIAMRLLPTIAFFQQRALYAFHRYLMKFLLLAHALGDGASQLGSRRWSWWSPRPWRRSKRREFSKTPSASSSSTRATFALQNLHSWWKSLSEVEKASRATIAHLIRSCEAVISEERLAWMSTSSTRRRSKEDEGD